MAKRLYWMELGLGLASLAALLWNPYAAYAILFCAAWAGNAARRTEREKGWRRAAMSDSLYFFGDGGVYRMDPGAPSRRVSP